MSGKSKTLALWAAAICVVFVFKAAAAQPAAAPDKAEPPLTLKDFLAPPTLSLVKLSPSGKAIVLVRRVGELDQVLRIDLPDFKASLLYQTHPLSSTLVKEQFRESIDYVDWKSEDTLVISVDTPVELYPGYSVLAPIHMILNAKGAAAPVYLNAAIKQGRARVDLSWIQSLLKDDPDHIMIGVRKDVYRVQLDRVDIKDASRTLLETDDADVISFGVDREGHILTRTLEHDDGSLTLQGRAVGQTQWTKVFDFRRKQQRELAQYDWLGLGDEGTLYIAAKPDTPSQGDTKAVRTYDLKTQTLGPVIWSNPAYDVDSIVQESESQRFLGGCYWVDTLQCDFKSPKLNANLKGLNRFFDGKRSLMVVSQSDDDGQWILFVTGPEDPGSYYVYDVKAHHLQELGAVWPGLPAERLGKMRRFEFKARDSTPLFAYVTEPPGVAKQPLPLVVMPHGGPESRDDYAYDQWGQFLATRGYIVMQPNFRGSDGFGRKFAEAGYGEWGGRMHDDVMDATRALIAEGKVDPKRVCILGGSYGGFEALYAAATEPATFRCAVSIDGISDLGGFVKSQKALGRDSIRYTYLLKAVGDPEADRAKLAARSPFRQAKTWTTPLLLIHGDEDELVPLEESRQMKRALENAGKPVRYVEVKGMGHGPSTDAETTKVFSEIDAFLTPYLKPDPEKSKP